MHGAVFVRTRKCACFMRFVNGGIHRVDSARQKVDRGEKGGEHQLHEREHEDNACLSEVVGQVAQVERADDERDREHELYDVRHHVLRRMSQEAHVGQRICRVGCRNLKRLCRIGLRCK